MFFKKFFVGGLLVFGLNVQLNAFSASGLYSLDIQDSEFESIDMSNDFVDVYNSYNKKLGLLAGISSGHAYFGDTNQSVEQVNQSVEQVKQFYEDNGFLDFKRWPYAEGIDNLYFITAQRQVNINGKSKKIVLISFRGTDTRSDILTDANVGFDEFTEANNDKIGVHSGFYKIINIMKTFENDIKINNISMTSLMQDPDTIFFLTGHSLGGGLASLYGTSLMERGVDDSRLLVYTLAAPAVGNLAFSRLYDYDGDKPLPNFRITNQTDPLPATGNLQILDVGGSETFGTFGTLIDWALGLATLTTNGLVGNRVFGNIGIRKTFDTSGVMGGAVAQCSLAQMTDDLIDGTSFKLKAGITAGTLLVEPTMLPVLVYSLSKVKSKALQEKEQYAFLPSCEAGGHKMNLYLSNLYDEIDMEALSQKLVDDDTAQLTFEPYELFMIEQTLLSSPQYRKAISGKTFDSSKLTELERKKFRALLRKSGIPFSYKYFGNMGVKIQQDISLMVSEKEAEIAILTENIDGVTSLDFKDYTKLTWGAFINTASAVSDLLLVGNLAKAKDAVKIADKTRTLARVLNLSKEITEEMDKPYFLVAKAMIESGFSFADAKAGDLTTREAWADTLSNAIGLAGGLKKSYIIDNIDTVMNNNKGKIIAYFLGKINDFATIGFQALSQKAILTSDQLAAKNAFLEELKLSVPYFGAFYAQYRLSQKISEDIDNDPKVIDAWSQYHVIVNDMIDRIRFLGEQGLSKRLDFIMTNALSQIKQDYTGMPEETSSISTLLFSLPENTTIDSPVVIAPQGETVSFTPSYTAKSFIECVNTAQIDGIDYLTINANLKWKLWYMANWDDLSLISIDMQKDGNSFSFVSPQSSPFGVYEITYNTEGKEDHSNNCVLPLTWEVITGSTGGSTATTPVKQTGQTTSYTAFDDGHYKAGVTPSYSRSEAGVVTDTVTGLEWQDDYSDNVGSIKQTTWQGAIDYCSTLGLDGGGWRLPSIEALESIVNDGRYNPTIDNTIFVNTASSNYWSSTTNADNTDDAWNVNFNYGNSNNYPKTLNNYVRCVRGGQ